MGVISSTLLVWRRNTGHTGEFTTVCYVLSVAALVNETEGVVHVAFTRGRP